MAGKHGFSAIYERQEQVNYGRSSVANEGRHHMSKAEGYRPKDQNKAMNQMLEENIRDEIAERYKHDPTYRATMNGNEPSRGAKADAEILREEEEMLRKKKDKSNGAGIQITPNASRILQRWALSPQLWASGSEQTYCKFHRYSGGLLATHRDFHTLMRANHGAPYLALHRVDLQTALHARAASLGVGFRFGTRIRRVDFETGELVSEDGEAVRGDLVVAADGLWSACRAQFLPKDFEGVPRPTGDLAYRVVLTLDQIRDPELRDWVSKPSINIWIGHNSHVVGYSLRNGTEFNLVLITPDDLPDDVRRAAGSAEEMRALFKNWDPVLNRFLAVVESVKKWKLMHRKEMRRWIHDSPNSHFVFVGDSCHPMLPYLGQGANSAIEDGAVLGRLLGHIKSKEQIGKALSMYEQLRKPRGDAIVKATDGQRADVHMADGPAQRARDELLLSQLDSDVKKDPFPIRWCSPGLQSWIFSYDACAEVDKAVMNDPFI
ncbi:FAD/NAD(P)-binding domain-containing protein [Hypoxylon fragiforme]|uniref:FAD/NAD(P)-binding domain-containing protein n=1 Tax=Hypoxylon fragiforme TaxID=63214 RepID=UPI0020C5DAAD|nr:FAD/NAD(P)-binding domain-containing protein [Hypoxylon fragiforme]KAI2613662.1 FAD/NAD(P)-binding domain-containing protein [Hypoxylon fragiforme]